MEIRKISDRQEKISLDMAFCCTGVCIFVKSTRVTSSQKYEQGQKRCTLCDIFLETMKLRCPCCNVKLRTKARSNKKRQ